MRSIDEKASIEMIDLLQDAEFRLTKLVANTTEETVARDVALVLRDLSAIRSRLERPLPSDKRVHGRIREPGVVVFRDAAGQKQSAALHDVSAGGALIECDTPPTEAALITVELPGLGRDVTALVRGVSGQRVHLAFMDLSPDDLVILLKYIERRFQRY